MKYFRHLSTLVLARARVWKIALLSLLLSLVVLALAERFLPTVTLSTHLRLFSSIILPAIGGSYHGYHSRFSFDVTSVHNPNWMAAFPDSTPLTALSIPGTHDTMTFNSSLTNLLQCQNHLLAAQLNAGIRYIDIRAALVNDVLEVYHQHGYTGFSYVYVLQRLFAFLRQNPKETILMRLKEENLPVNSTMTFEEAFNHYRLKHPATAHDCEKHFWLPPPEVADSEKGITTIPSLGSLRGKILIIQNFGPVHGPYGVKYENPLLIMEDYWELRDLGDMDAKFEAITTNLEAAAKGIRENDGNLYLSHVSASVGVDPIDVAAGPYNRSMKGQNDRVGEWLRAGGGGNGSTGVVILDFPGGLVVEEVLRRNEAVRDL